MPSRKMISYLRVSTDKQGIRGLGMDAQRTVVEQYRSRMGWELVQEYVEVESGKRADRPELDLAIAHAKRIGAVVVFAKLDRLARNTRFLLNLIASGAELAFCDLPDMPAGAMGRGLLQIMAVIAELEAGLVSERTKAALEAKRARGERWHQTQAPHVLAAAAAGLGRKADEHAAKLRDTVAAIRAGGATTPYAVAKALTERKARTPRGGTKWQALQARHLMERLDRLA